VIIGTLGSAARARVDGGGAIELPNGITVSWWIGAEDRWHVPSQDITVRQSLVAHAPVPRVAVRVPGGDLVTTVAAVQQGQRELIVLDVANQGAVPVAVAFVVSGPRARDITVDGSTVRVAGRPVLYLPRAPQLTASASSSDALLQALGSDGFGPVDPQASHTAFLVPITHRTTVRAAVLLAAASTAALAAAPVLSALPDAATVAKGWGVQVGRVPSLDGDGARDVRLRALAAAVLLESDAFTPDAPGADVVQLCALARACSRLGLHPEAERLLRVLDDLQGLRGSIGPADEPLVSALAVAAVADHALLSRNEAFATSMAPVVAGALEFLQKRGSHGVAVFGAAAQFFALIGEKSASRNSDKHWTRAGSPWPLPRAALPPLPALSAGGSLLPDDVVRLSDEVLDTVGGIATEAADGSLVLLGDKRAEDLLGLNMVVRNVPTVAGRLSYAVRWHGARPALLWEFDSGPGAAIAVPSLAPGSVVPAAPQGEVLLSGPRP
jgi:hypothetical protein